MRRMRRMKHMRRMMDALIAYLSEEKQPYYHTESDQHLFIPITGTSGRLKCIVEAREDQRQILFVALLQISIPADKVPAVAEFIARVNATLTIGSFDLDVDDRLVAYRTSIEVAETPLTPALIRPLPRYAIAMADKYLPGIVAVVTTDVLPADALNYIERHSLEEMPGLANESLN